MPKRATAHGLPGYRVEPDRACEPLTKREQAAYKAALKRGRDAHAEAARMLRAAAENAEFLVGEASDAADADPATARAWMAYPQDQTAHGIARSLLACEERRREAKRLEALRRRGARA